MDEDVRSAQNARLIHRVNQIVSGVVACAVLGVGGLMAYQNRDSLKAPDAKAGWSGFFKKKFEAATAIHKVDLPEFQAPDWEKNGALDPSKLGIGQGIQFGGPIQLTNTPRSSSHRRHHP
jgi:hypothetical protein